MNNIKEQERELEAKREELLLAKRQHEKSLEGIRTLIKTSGRMPNEKYRQCCNAQTRHVTAIAKINGALIPLREKERELVLQEFEDRQVSMEVKAVETQKLKRTVQALVDLRAEYQRFGGDYTRVSSMRLMAAQFANRISDIIAQAISKDKPNNERMAA